MLIRRKKEIKVNEKDGKKLVNSVKTEMKKVGKNYVDLMKESTKELVSFKH